MCRDWREWHCEECNKCTYGVTLPCENCGKADYKEYMTIFINGKQKRVKRPPTIDGMDVDEFIRRNADPIRLHQNQMWEYMTNDDES